MKDLKLTADGDLDISSGDAVIVDSLAQAILVRLRWHLGEWKINKNYGVPYFDNVLGQKFNETFITQDIFDVFSEVKGIKSVESFSVRRRGRGVHIRFAVIGENGRETGEISI